jgi:hypothetical protein
MSTIIAGRFQGQDEAQAALHALMQAGLPEEHTALFFVNPPGQHDLYPVGGDSDDSPGAHRAPEGAATGAAVGGAVGLLVGGVVPAIVPAVALAGAAVGAGLGAYTGSLLGTLNHLGEPVKPGSDGAAEHAAQEQQPLRHSGMLVAAETPDEAARDLAMRVLREQGAVDIEENEGHIVAGQWRDFDPLEPPHLIETSQTQALPVEDPAHRR